jgi:hypothetical protein
MIIIFLDHDGPLVLNHNRAIATSLLEVFATSTINTLNEILLNTDAEIVISSDWRRYFSLADLRDLYRDLGVISLPISVTPNLAPKNSESESLEKIRTKEILTWLRENEKHKPITKWVAVDDLPLLISSTNFVRTDDGTLGISDPKIKNQIIKCLL